MGARIQTLPAPLLPLLLLFLATFSGLSVLKRLGAQSSFFLYTFLKLIVLMGQGHPLGSFENLWRQFGSHNDD